MATLGIIGGIAPPSTVAYYQATVDVYRQRSGGRVPHVLINSIDGDEVFAHLSAGRIPELAALLEDGLRQLADAGATVALLASVSVHVAFDELRQNAPLPLIDLVAATVAASRGNHRLGIFATSFTAEADLFGPALAQRGMTAVHPGSRDQAVIHRIYFDELVKGKFLADSRQRLLDIARRMQADTGIDGVLLAGTELPLLLPNGDYDGLRFIDTGRAHVEAAVRRMLAD